MKTKRLISLMFSFPQLSPSSTSFNAQQLQHQTSRLCLLPTLLCWCSSGEPQIPKKQTIMADLFLIFVIVVAFVILTIIGLYLVVKYQHPDDKNDAYFPKLVVLFGFVLAGATVLLLPLDVANNEGFAGA